MIQFSQFSRIPSFCGRCDVIFPTFLVMDLHFSFSLPIDFDVMKHFFASCAFVLSNDQSFLLHAPSFLDSVDHISDFVFSFHSLSLFTCSSHNATIPFSIFASKASRPQFLECSTNMLKTARCITSPLRALVGNVLTY
jgi:hypothetical protein